MCTIDLVVTYHDWLDSCYLLSVFVNIHSLHLWITHGRAVKYDRYRDSQALVKGAVWGGGGRPKLITRGLVILPWKAGGGDLVDVYIC